MTTTEIGGEAKPVPVVGNAHAHFDDGHVIAVLNPDKSLADEIKLSIAYGSTNLKGMARGRCEALVDVFVTGLNTPHRTSALEPVAVVFEKTHISCALQADTSRAIAPQSGNQLIRYYF